MQVSEIMHKGVTMVQINDSIKHVASIMAREDIGSLPVYKFERPVGFVTDRDIVISCVSKGLSPDVEVAQAMTPKIISVYENQNVEEAARIMEENQISRLLVLDKGDTPVGVLSLQNIAQSETSEETKTELLSGIKKFD